MNNNKKELNLKKIWVKFMLFQQVKTNTSKNYYDEVFKSFIEKSGGSISVETLIIDERYLDWYNCRKAEAKNTLKFETGERISKIQYNELKIAECKRNILNNCATKDKKEAILKHSVDIKVKTNVEVNLLVYDVYKNHKHHFDNIETELKQNVLNLITHDDLLDSIDSKQSKTSKVFQIQLIHGILGTKNSMDRSTIITEEKFMNIVNSYNQNDKTRKLLMKFIDDLIINFNSKSKLRIYPNNFDNLKKCYQKIKTVFNSILISWCGVSIKSKDK
jgi:hypothetical protein